MIYKWETEEQRLLKYMRISPKQKLEWLRQINEFVHKYSSNRNKTIRKKMRKMF